MDLDFFTPRFSASRVAEIVKFLSSKLKKKIELVAEQTHKGRARIRIYSVQIKKDDVLKMDFVEDYIKLIKQPKLINGIKVLSLEDIYIHKIFAINLVMH